MENNELLEQYIRNQRLNRKIVLVLIPMFLIMAVAIVFYALKSNQNEKIAVESQEHIEQLNDSISNLIANCELSKTEIEARYSNLLVEFPKQLDSIIELPGRNASELKDELSYQLKSKIQSHEDRFEKLSKVIYIQFASKQDLAQVRQLERSLSDMGYVVRKPELVEKDFKNGIRFFNAEDQEEAEYLEIMLSNQNGIGELPAQDFTKTKSASANQIEIWINSKRKK